MEYVELHCHSNFSLLDGANHPEELVSQAADLQMPALALTDHDAVYGAPRFINAARQVGLQPILGAELTLTGDFHLTLLVENEIGWHNLCYLISRARHARPKGEAELNPQELIGCTEGLIALSGCRQGQIAAALRQNDRSRALEYARHYAELFGKGNFYIEIQRHLIPGEQQLVNSLASLASYLQLPVVATNNVHYAARDRHKLQDVLVCIRHLTDLDAASQGTAEQGRLLRFNSEYYLKPAHQMAALFAGYPQAIENTLLIAGRCGYQLNYGLQDLPPFPTPHGMSSSAYLRRLCEEGYTRLYGDQPESSPHRKTVRRQLVHELEVIERAGLANYFLIVWDIVRFSRDNGIRCQGRGSAANSLVAYLLHISPVDPLLHDLVFERFLSAERTAIPDIDIDFDAQRREEVIQYIYSTYGAEHTAMACTFITFRSRSALRDIGKALNIPPEAIIAAARQLEESTIDQDPRGSNPELKLPSNRPGLSGTSFRDYAQRELEDGSTSSPPASEDQLPVSILLELSRQIEGFPRHLGIHSGGMIITGPPLMGRVPTEPATMPDRVVVQWDKEGLEDAGLVKIDILGLRMLSALTESAALIEETTGKAVDLDRLSFDDKSVYEMIGRADTVGVFQVESRAQAQMLPRLRPRHFNDIVVAISLIRPGPIQGDMVHPYLRRRLGLETIVYTHPLLEPALAETMGVILFQEQVLKVARDLAGFTAGQGELLRRALGSKRAGEAIEQFHETFVAGALAQGVPADIAEQVFDQLRAFGGYSFAKSHAAAFAVIVYQSGWLKQYYPAHFLTALLNNQPMGFWNPAVLVGEAKRSGLQVLPVDLQISGAKCQTVIEPDGYAIRLGFNYVKSLREEHIEHLIAEREKAPFTSLADFYRRVRPGRLVTENLILSGAMDYWGLPRRQLLWEMGTITNQDGELELVYPSDKVDLPAQSAAEAMMGEQEVLGLSTGDHVMAFYRNWLVERGILGSDVLALYADGQFAKVAGLVVVHQSPPTAKGHHFITLEDEAGMMNIIIRPKVYDRYRRVLREERLLLFEGKVQREGDVISFLARRVKPLEDIGLTARESALRGAST